MLSHVKETTKDWMDKDMMDKCKGIKLFLPLLMNPWLNFTIPNPSTVTNCFGYQKYYSMKTKCVRPDKKNADNETFAFDKLRQTAHGIVEKGMHLKLEI